MSEIEKVYNPGAVEDGIYEKWEKSGYFNPDNLPRQAPSGKGKRKSFSIVMPPPNVTGTLHLGHAVMLAIEDILIRYHRMRGERTLWLPGTDHAAIATQTKVEKILKEREGKTRHDFGREKFLAEVEKFISETKGVIKNQIRKIGSSCDWSREAYTLDEPRSRAVRTVFKMMYDDGLIYRGERIVNWCPRCGSTLADDEVEYKTQKAKFYTFKYSKDFPFAIATTRPETKLGDTAVAVNPEDARYKKYVGKTFEVNFVGVPLKLKIITDRSIDVKFGTGALGVTPAHSMVDWQMAEKNNLPIIKVIDEQGKIRDGFAEYSGKTTEVARELIVEKLKIARLIEKEEEIENNLSICYRCGTPVEPLPSLQWFIDVNKKIPKYKKSLKELSIEAVKKGIFGRKKIEIIPEQFEKVYFHWMENLRDWCISRQIWFGHRVPVWYRESQNPAEITYFVHGSTVDNEKKLASGHADVPLSNLGIEESEKLKNLIRNRKFDVIFCSDLRRAVQTAEIVFGKNVIKDKRLREIDYGKLTQKKTDKVYGLKSEMIYNSFPGGESYKDIESRMGDFLSEIVEKYPGKKIAIVAHQAPQLALDVLLKHKTWGQSLEEDWRNTKSWQPGWDYKLEKLTYVGIEAPKGEGWTQDPDTLDTWFSSGLWTFSTLGWPASPSQGGPEKTKDLKTYHPTSVLETGYDILFFWIARMILMTTYVLGDIPFHKVYLHGLVRDEKGRKMSKSLGNIIDPLDMIEKYGTDAVRLSLVLGTSPGNDTKLNEEKISGFRNFTNKLWNIGRYVIEKTKGESGGKKIKAETLAEKWILSRLNNVVGEVTNHLEKFEFSQAGEKLRAFTWDEFADWYVEINKLQSNPSLLITLYSLLLKLWHPFMPFVTETLWPNFGEKLLMIADWPKAEKKLSDKKAEKDFEVLKNIIVAIRSLRADYKVEPAKKVSAVIYGAAKTKLLEEQAEIFKVLARVENLEIKKSGAKPAQSAGAVISGIEIYLPLAGLVDLVKEKERLNKELAEAEKYLGVLESKLSNKAFIANAPKELVAGEKEKLEAQKEKVNKIKEQLKSLE